MHFALTEEQRMIQQLAREFAQQEIAPLSAQHDREQSFPLPVHAKALELGLLNIAMPAEFGGAGLGALEVALVTEQLCRACLGIGTALCVNALAAEPILLAGTSEQKQAWLPRLAAGEHAGKECGGQARRGRGFLMAVSLVLDQWSLLTLDYRHDMRKPPQGRLSLCGGFDVCADKTCQNEPVPFW